MPLSSQAVLEKWGPIAAADPEGGSGPFHFWFVDEPSGQAATPSVTHTLSIPSRTRRRRLIAAVKQP